MAADNAMDIRASLTLEADQYTSGMKKVTDATNAELEAQKKAHREARKVKELEAKYGADAVTSESEKVVKALMEERIATQEYRKAAKLTRDGYADDAAAVNIAAAAYQRMLAAKAEVVALTQVEAVATEHSVSQTMAASAAIRSFEGNPGIRSIERFVTTIPGVGAALQAAFPIVGGVAFIAMVAEMIVKFREMQKQAQELPNKIRDAYRELHISAATANDQLRITDDRLANEIAKIEGKPQNNLALAIDETRLKADELAKSFAEAIKRSKELLEQNKVTFLSQVMGSEGTGGVAGSVNSFRSDMADLAYQKMEAVRAGDLQKAADFQKQLEAKQKAYMDWLDSQIKMRTGMMGGPGTRGATMSYASVNGDQHANLAVLRGERMSMQDAQSMPVEQQRNAALVAQKAALEGQASGHKDLMKQLEAQFHEQQLLHEMTLKAEYDFWDARRNLFKQGSEEYNQILAKQTEIALHAAEKAHAVIQQERRRQLQEGGPGAKVYDFRAQNKDAFDADSSRLAESNQAAMQDARNQAKRDELRIEEEIGRTITHSAGAAQLAAVHAREYAEELKSVALEIARVQSDGYLTDAQRAEKLKPLELQQNQLRQDASTSAARDAYGASSRASSYGVGAVDALDELASASKNAAAEMNAFVKSAVSSVNNNIIKDMMGQGKKGDWRHTGAGILQSGASSALKQAEGYGLKLLGFGGGKKADGSASAPFHVIMAGGAAAGIGSAIPSIPGIGGFGSMLKGLASGLHIPGFAAGGDAPGNSLIMVGENGPELMRTGSSGASIIPNHQIAAMGGGGGSQVIHIDARGTDPAMTHAAVQRAMSAAAARGAAEGARRAQESFRRSPR